MYTTRYMPGVGCKWQNRDKPKYARQHSAEFKHQAIVAALKDDKTPGARDAARAGGDIGFELTFARELFL